MELDARTAPERTALEGDVCIIGAGPAGLALARSLGQAGKRVVLLESGGRAVEPEAQELNVGETPGEARQDLRLSRARAVGGSSLLWNTMYRETAWAKFIPLDSIDFEEREGIRWSGWPFGRAELEPWYQRAHALLGLGPFGYGADYGEGGKGPLEFPSESLVNGIYRFGARGRLVSTIVPGLLESSSVTLVHGATATAVSTGPGGIVTGIEWATLSGNRGTAHASHFVLAAGGIENARFLLHAMPGNPWLGRGFMEHPVDSSLTLVTRAPALCPEPGFYAAHEPEPGLPVLGRIGISPGLMRSEGLCNASVRLVLDEEPPVLQSERILPMARRLVPFPRARRMIGGAIRRASGWRRRHAARYRLLIDLEQDPHPDNRVTLASGRDALGMPRPLLEWRWREEEQARLLRVRRAVTRELERAGAGTIQVSDHSPLDPFVHHHVGATRMHRDPRFGVVDAGLRSHEAENLYVVGSSVFPSAGFANPTLTSVALALRLGDRLAGGR
ncbi:MAG TPA: GMC family oxidoreductase [Gemmatimonadales bacterium]